jgi:hypothetical protein
MAHHGPPKSISLAVVPRYVLALMPIAIALAFALLRLGYFSARGAFFLTAIAVNMWCAVRDCAFRRMSTMFVR